ncbi:MULTISPECIES: hypothetical protein [Sinorhizobium]
MTGGDGHDTLCFCSTTRPLG